MTTILHSLSRSVHPTCFSLSYTYCFLSLSFFFFPHSVYFIFLSLFSPSSPLCFVLICPSSWPLTRDVSSKPCKKMWNSVHQMAEKVSERSEHEGENRCLWGKNVSDTNPNSSVREENCIYPLSDPFFSPCTFTETLRTAIFKKPHSKCTTHICREVSSLSLSALCSFYSLFTRQWRPTERCVALIQFHAVS